MMGLPFTYERWMKDSTRNEFIVICKTATYTSYNVFEGTRLVIYLRDQRLYCKEEKEFNKQFTKLPIKLP